MLENSFFVSLSLSNFVGTILLHYVSYQTENGSSWQPYYRVVNYSNMKRKESNKSEQGTLKRWTRNEVSILLPAGNYIPNGYRILCISYTDFLNCFLFWIRYIHLLIDWSFVVCYFWSSLYLFIFVFHFLSPVARFSPDISQTLCVSAFIILSD